MVIDYNNYMWCDSELESINIVHNQIVIVIFNDTLKKNVTITCSECLGMTQLITWDEGILDYLDLFKVDEKHPMVKQIKDLYGTDPNTFDKGLVGDVYSLKVALINDTSFEVLCKKVVFECEDE